MNKLLIVEDEDMLAEMYQDKFDREGFDVDLARSAEEAIEKLKGTEPDLILLDILLPGENGTYFLEQLKEDPELETSAKIIAFSNYNEDKTKKKAEELGVEEYLLKTDFTPNQIVEEVKKIIK